MERNRPRGFNPAVTVRIWEHFTERMIGWPVPFTLSTRYPERSISVVVSLAWSYCYIVTNPPGLNTVQQGRGFKSRPRNP